MICNFDSSPILTLEGRHWSLTAVQLISFTDNTDTLTETTKKYLFNEKISRTPGDIFAFENNVTGKAYALIVFAADFEKTEVFVQKNSVFLHSLNQENKDTAEKMPVEYELIETTSASWQSDVRTFLRKYLVTSDYSLMSNTWGDGNAYNCVSEDFVKKEIDAAKKYGIDSVQIDDGWQIGNTGDMSIRDEHGHRRFDGNFWDEKKEKFPNGLKSVTRYGKDNGIGTGLWFAPDFHSNFAHKDRDIKVISNYFKDGDCDFLKLDMIYISTTSEKKAFLDMLSDFEKYSTIELDVTRGPRLGYLEGIKHGIMFVENRYTMSGNYYPYKTMRNLWNISRYFPAQALQFEIANPDLYKEKYGQNDDLSPSKYKMDYVFASVMFSNPLFWLELQNLSEARAKEFSDVYAVWQGIRKELFKCDIFPIGQEPDGFSFTGFFAQAQGGDESYAVLLREKTKNDTFEYETDARFSSCEIISGKGKVSVSGGKITAVFPEENSYILLKIK